MSGLLEVSHAEDGSILLSSLGKDGDHHWYKLNPEEAEKLGVNLVKASTPRPSMTMPALTRIEEVRLWIGRQLIGLGTLISPDIYVESLFWAARTTPRIGLARKSAEANTRK